MGQILHKKPIKQPKPNLYSNLIYLIQPYPFHPDRAGRGPRPSLLRTVAAPAPASSAPFATSAAPVPAASAPVATSAAPFPASSAPVATSAAPVPASLRQSPPPPA